MIVDVPLITRGYECDATRTVTLPSFLSYLEHMRWEWIRQPELGLVDHLHGGSFFVVREQRLALARRVGLGVPLVVRGALERVTRCEVTVRQQLVTESGELVAHGVVKGLWVGPNRRLARVPDSVRSHVTPLELAPRSPAEPGGRPASFLDPETPTYDDIALDRPVPTGAPEGAVVEQITVRRSDCDIFNHVNAASWVRYIEDLRQRAFDPRPGRRVCVSFLKEAVADESITVAGWPEAGGWGFQIMRGDDVLCRAIVDA